MPKKVQEETKAKQIEGEGGDPERPDNRVPEWAEDMEHTLRRLVREKEQQRSKHPELYR